MEKEILEKYINDGLSSYKIAEITNHGQTTIRYWLKKYNLKTNHKEFTKNPYTTDTQKQCSVCKEVLSKTKEFFYVDKEGCSSQCKKCHQKKCKKRLRNYKQECVDYKGGKCIVCNYNRSIDALDFHHLDPSKKEFDISKSSKSFKNLKEELNKCVILCSNCHRELHAGLITLNIKEQT